MNLSRVCVGCNTVTLRTCRVASSYEHTWESFFLSLSGSSGGSLCGRRLFSALRFICQTVPQKPRISGRDTPALFLLLKKKLSRALLLLLPPLSSPRTIQTPAPFHPNLDARRCATPTASSEGTPRVSWGPVKNDCGDCSAPITCQVVCQCAMQATMCTARVCVA